VASGPYSPLTAAGIPRSERILREWLEDCLRDESRVELES
jgi:hypothetical protein